LDDGDNKSARNRHRDQLPHFFHHAFPVVAGERRDVPEQLHEFPSIAEEIEHGEQHHEKVENEAGDIAGQAGGLLG
jgi:hypothetical protein